MRFYIQRIDPSEIKLRHGQDMRTELQNIELYGGEVGERNNADYMFTDENEIDMDAFCDPYISVHKVGESTDMPTYFDKVNSRLGIKAREEVSGVAAPSPESSE